MLTVRWDSFFVVVGYSGRGFFPLWETTEEFFFRCGIQRRRFSSVMGYNRRGFFPLRDTRENNLRMANKFFFYCIPQRGKFSFRCILHHNRILCSVLYPRKIFRIVSHNAEGFLPLSHNGRYFPPLWNTTEEVFFRCGIQRKKLSSIVGYNAAENFLIFELN
jgi:hypothetical protein